MTYELRHTLTHFKDEDTCAPVCTPICVRCTCVQGIHLKCVQGLVMAWNVIWGVYLDCLLFCLLRPGAYQFQVMVVVVTSVFDSHYWVTSGHLCPVISTWFWGGKIRSSCLSTNCITCWAIFPATQSCSGKVEKVTDIEEWACSVTKAIISGTFQSCP